MSERLKEESSPAIAKAIGSRVLVGWQYRRPNTDQWQDVPGYALWEGEVRPLPRQSACNGNVFIMPDKPRGVADEYASLHPTVCDTSPSDLEVAAGVVVQVRHVVIPLETLGIQSPGSDVGK